MNKCRSVSPKRQVSMRMQSLCIALAGGFACTTTAFAEQPLSAKFELWAIEGGASPLASQQQQALLRPRTDSEFLTLPQLDFAAGIGRDFANGLSLDAGVTLSHGPQLEPVNYRDYFLGLRYGSWDGKLWYLPDVTETHEPSSLYYEAGWSRPVGEQVAISVRVGQQHALGNTLLDEHARTPNLSFGATTELRGYGLGLRLMETGGRLFGGEEEFQLMGSISKPIP